MAKWTIILIMLSGCYHAPAVSKARHDMMIDQEIERICRMEIGTMWYLACIEYACRKTGADCG